MQQESPILWTGYLTWTIHDRKGNVENATEPGETHRPAFVTTQESICQQENPAILMQIIRQNNPLKERKKIDKNYLEKLNN